MWREEATALANAKEDARVPVSHVWASIFNPEAQRRQIASNPLEIRQFFANHVK